MKKIFFIATTLMCISALLQADCDHSTKSQDNYMIPVGRIVLNPDLPNCGLAASVMGEVGVRNYRLNATAGTWTTEQSRLKVTGEYLTQKLHYGFITGSKDRWVHQGAAGADWQFLLDSCSILQAFDLRGYYSYAGSKDLKTGHCADPEALTTSFETRIAGSNAYGGSFSGVFLLSEICRFDLSLDYDHVKYRRKYNSPKTVEGFGGSFVWMTRFVGCFDFSLEGQFRRPFNYLGARLTYPRACGSPNTVVSLFAGWTKGKYSLPNSLKAGVELAYNFQLGSCCDSTPRESCPVLWDPCDLNAWVLVPAVYMPEVLAIADACPRVSSTSIVAPQYESGSQTPYSFDVSPYFASKEPLVYSAVGLPEGVTINPSTGVINGFISGFDTYNITVTGSNGCSVSTQTFILSPIVA